MAISGLHIGLAASSAYLFGWLASTFIVRRRPARDVALVIGLLAAFGYALVSGFAVPALRASSMAVGAAALLLCRRRVRSLDILAVVLAGLFLLAPLSAMTPGFKLSFAAVAVLLLALRIVVVAPIKSAPWGLAGVRRLIMLQWFLMFSLAPVTLAEFGRLSIVAPLVNLVVLPVFNLVTVPVTLLAMLADGPLAVAGNVLFAVAHRGIVIILWLLEHVAVLPNVSFEPAGSRRWVTLLPVLYLVLPPGWPGRGIALVALTSIITFRPPDLRHGCVAVRVLDVGQGLAVVIQTSHKQLLYDTGPSFRSGGSVADFVVNPYLRYRGIDSLDLLIVSHADLDHAGGAGAIHDAMQVRDVIAGEPVDGIALRQCRQGDAWQWNGVEFRTIHPRPGSPWTGNNASCVVEISVGSHRILLTGDIESPVERLLDYRSMLRPSRVVVVPHHGSRTSSSTWLVDSTHPELAIVSAAYGNRWGFPKSEVVNRWQNSGSRVLSTANSGAVEITLCSDGAMRIHENRRESRRYWHDARPDTP